MKNIIKPIAVLGVLTVACALSQAQTASVHQEWRFGTDANPAPPEVSSGVATATKASLVPGQFASGWLEQNAILGASTGIWDLGRNGTMTLGDWSGLSVASTSERQVTLQVLQWHD